MSGAAGADFFVAGVGGGATGVADGGGPDAGGLPEHALGAPEAAHAEDGGFGALWERGFEGVAEDEVAGGDGQRFVAAGECVGWVDDLGLGAGHGIEESHHRWFASVGQKMSLLASGGVCMLPRWIKC